MSTRGLSEDQVRAIRKDKAEGVFNPKEWARVTGLSVYTILRAARGDTYHRVGDDPTPVVGTTTSGTSVSEFLAVLEKQRDDAVETAVEMRPHSDAGDPQ